MPIHSAPAPSAAWASPTAWPTSGLGTWLITPTIGHRALSQCVVC